MTAPAVELCTPGTLDDCATCGEPMHRGALAARTCQYGHRLHEGRGLCRRCYGVLCRRGLLDGHPRGRLGRDEVLQAWADLAEIGAATFGSFAAHIGMTYGAWERAYLRARRAGHPLARRFDLET